jgi:DNA-binding CsgD family transcriptional regulator
MHEDEKLAPLIGSIYDAALDAALWTDVLANIADFVDGQAAGLVSKDLASKSGSVHYQFGVEPHYMRLYETHSKFDPTATLPFFDVGQVVSTTDLVPYDEFRQGRFYQEWARPQGFIDAANAVLEKSLTSFAYLSVIRGEASGMVDDRMRGRMRLVIPHVRRAVLVGKAIDQAEATTFAEAIDGLSAGILLVDAGGQIVHANVAGHLILRSANVLRAIGGRLVAGDAEADRALREIFAIANGGDAALGTRGIALPLTGRNGERYVAHALPLSPAARRSAGSASAAATALFVRKAALEAPSAPEVIAKTYKLTPTELRVLLAIVEVGGVPDVAGALGVAESTVKTHLGRLFDKTGTGRQADLVKLVAGFSNALMG